MNDTNIPVDFSDLERFRKEVLHKYPEISGEEKQTAESVREFLRRTNPTEIIDHIGGHGVAAVYDSGHEGPVLLFRCELDALPIQETNTFPHRSMYDNMGHKCGHDGHMAVILGLAQWVGREKPARGRVVCLFQPAEEIGEGAHRVLHDPQFERIVPDYVFAMHNVPGYPLGQVIVRPGPFTPAVKSMIVSYTGKTAHAGEPQKGLNPAMAMTEFVQLALELHQNDQQRDDYRVITPVYMTLGEKTYGTAAGYGEVHLTIRAKTNESMNSLGEEVEKRARECGSTHGLMVDVQWLQVFHANENHPKAVNWILAAAEKEGMDIRRQQQPFGWGEDFGLFTERFPGALFGLGSGEDQPALHNPDYDFPDALTPYGVRIFRAVIDEVLND